MSPNTIRKIDYWVGKPICCLLSFFSSSTPKNSTPKKIVFLKFIEQGATVLAYNAMKRATELVGKENVYFCVFKTNHPILDIIDIIPAQNIISISDTSLSSFLLSAWGALRKIRQTDVDTAIDMEFFSRASAIFSYLSGAKNRVGLHRFTSELPYRGNLMTHRIQYNPYLHIAEFYTLLVEASLHNPAEIPMMKIPWKEFIPALPVFAPSPSELEKMREKIDILFKTRVQKKIIILNPNASDLLPLRKWERKKFIELGKKIISEHPEAYIILSGALSEKSEAEDTCKQIGSERTISLAGQTSLRELMTMYSLSDLLITNDSGPGHFSALTTIKTIILFGPETPQLFGPISPNAHVIWKKLSCSPCVSVLNHRFSPCNNNICMKSITVEEVYAVVKKLIVSSA